MAQASTRAYYMGRQVTAEVGQEFTVMRGGAEERATLTAITPGGLIFTTESGATVRTAANNIGDVIEDGTDGGPRLNRPKDLIKAATRF